MTNRDLKKEIKQLTPKSLSNAEKLLAATDNMINKKSLFSTESSRISKTQFLVYKLFKSLKEEGYIEVSDSFPNRDSDIEYIYGFMTQVASTYPNWREEYAKLNKFIKIAY